MKQFYIPCNNENYLLVGENKDGSLDIYQGVSCGSTIAKSNIFEVYPVVLNMGKVVV